jgi:hypothetical protein
VLREALRRVGCAYQFRAHTKRPSVPRKFAEEVADAIRTGQVPARVVVKDPELW